MSYARLQLRPTPYEVARALLRPPTMGSAWMQLRLRASEADTPAQGDETRRFRSRSRSMTT